MSSSVALARFSERLDEVTLLLNLCSSSDASIKDQTAAISKNNALLRGALVLLCSHIEGFFEDLVGDVLTAYGKLATTAVRIPIEIRAHQVIGKRDRWNNSDTLQRWRMILECVRHPLVGDSQSVPVTSIDAELHTTGFANPSTVEIGKLFQTLGISEVWNEFARFEPDQVVKGSVDIIVNRRNQIAHGNLESTVAKADVELYVERVKRLAEAMDKLVAEQICSRLNIKNVWVLVQDDTSVV